MKRTGIALGVVVATAAPAGADTLRGWMQQPLREAMHKVEVKLDGGVAKLTVRRTFENLGEIPEEANLDLTLPPGAVASGLRLRTSGGWEAGTLMDARLATGEYEELTGIGDHKVLKDPALLEWLDVGTLSLRVFPVPPGGTATVEYELVMPTEYEEGRVVLYYPEPSGNAEKNLIRPDVTAAKGTIARAAVLPDEAADDEGEEENEAEEVGPQRWTRISLPPPAIDVMAARYGVLTVNADTDVVRLELDAAPELAPKPKKARVIFVVDASLSVGAAGIQEQIALAKGYMSHLPDAKYDMVLFRRDAVRVAGELVGAGELERAIERAGKLDKLRPGNGSNMETGLAAAADALKEGKKGPARIVVFTDGAMRLGFSPSLAVALLARAPEKTIVHVVRRESEAEAIFLRDSTDPEPLAEERADGDPLAAVAAAYGGVALQVSGQGKAPADYARIAHGLVQPIRIDDFVVTAAEWDTSEFPAVLPAGASVRHMVAVYDQDPGAVRVSGKLWAEPWTKNLAIDLAYSQKVTTLLFGDDVVETLNEEDVRRLAMAAQVVSPYTSYLAVEPGVQPATQGIDRDQRWDTIGSGEGGAGAGYAVGDGGGGPDADLEQALRDMLQPAAVSCGALEVARIRTSGDPLGTLEIETTDQEIVDVRITGAATAVVASCLVEQAWQLSLGAVFSGHFTHRAELIIL